MQGSIRMHEKLKYLVRLDEEAGIRIGLIGLAFVLPGVALGFLGWPSFGYGVALLGVIFVFLGLFIHFFFNWRSVLHIGPKSDVENKERHIDKN